MNCSQIEKFLPLYAGHDLSARREQLIAAHLKSCAACDGAAAEYREARDMIHSFAPPAFSDDIYAEIRKSVWQQIETGRRVPLLFETVAAWFQPRFVLTAATALLITVSVVGVYFLAKRSTVPQEAVLNVPKTGLEPDNGSGEKPTIIFSNLNEGMAGQHQAEAPNRQRRPDRMVTSDRVRSLVAYSRDAQGSRVESSSPVIGTDNLDLATRDAERTLRMEIQTKNPNIRIIWFAPKEPKPVAVHAKGI